MDLTEFQRGVIVGASLAGASLSKTAEICNVSKSSAYNVLSAYCKRGKTTSDKTNCGRKRKLSQRDASVLKIIVSKKRKTTAERVTAELNTHLDSPVSTKTVRRELHRANIYG